MTDDAPAALRAVALRLFPDHLLHPADRLPVLLAALVSVQGLWRWPLWEDEIFTQNVATELPLAKVFEMAERDRHPPGYFLLEWILGRLNESDVWMRLPSALAAVGAVAIVAHLGRKHLGLGGLAAWLLPFLPFFLVYGSMARAYAILLAIGAGLLAANFLPPRRAAVSIAVLGALGLYAHYAMALPLVAAVGALAARAWVGSSGTARLRALLPAVGAAIGAGVAFAPWAIAVTGAQASRESRQAPDLAVLQWALWPVGGLIPYVAWPMLALALVGTVLAVRGKLAPDTAPGSDLGRGARAVLVPWILAALLLPIAASTRSMTAAKTYVFAPLLPLFVLLCAAGIQWLVRTLRARLAGLAPVAVLAPLALLTLPDACTVFQLPAAPLELGLTSSGGRDVREDIAILAELAPELNPRYLDNRAWTPYQRYMAGDALPPDRPAEAWFAGWRRVEGADATAMTDGAEDRGCFFRRAFLNLIYVREQRMCVAIRDAVAAAAEADGYAPFVLQAADFARERGDLEESERLATLALGGMGPSVEPSVFLARRQLERGDTAAALASLEDALPLARRWRDDGQVAMLFEEEATIYTEIGDTAGAEAALEAVKCARSDAPVAVCGRWLQRYWDIEPPPRPTGSRPQ